MASENFPCKPKILNKFLYNVFAGLGIRSFEVRANRSFFVQKWANEPFAPKNEQFTHSLIFGEQPERLAHDRSFPLSHLSKSLMVAHFWWAKLAICSHCSFDLSEISISLTVAQRKWATVSEWANERIPSPGNFNFFYF